MRAVEPPEQRPDVQVEAHRVAAILGDLSLDGIVDLHTHFMPDQVLRKVWAYFDQADSRLGQPWTIWYRGTESERLADLRALGATRFTSLNYPHRPDMAAWLNAWSADFASSTPDCAPSATFFPEASAASYVAEALAAGVQIFKAHVQVGGYDPIDPLLEPVWAQIEEARTPVVIHAGSGPEPGRYTGPERIESVLVRHPRLTLVIAHLGMPEYTSFMDLAQRYPNVHLDTTMSFTDFTESMLPFPREELPRLADLGDRIVFGSDFPNIPYAYAHAVEVLQRLDLGTDWLRAVLHDNGARLLGSPTSTT